jgi:glutathione-regulated potassium-efflux system ancillary protein KefC/glutathione-regulated potassium-efflux system protein KefB
MDSKSLIIQALVYLTAGVVSVPIAKRLGLGSVLGYIIAGVIVGPFLLNLVGEQGDVMRFAEFGIVIMLFLIGLEVRPQLLWKMRTAIFGIGGGQLVATSAAVALAGLALGLDWRVAAAAGLILAMSSTAIGLQSLEERGLRQGQVGESAFGVLLFQDLSVIPLFALLPLLAPAGAAHHAAEGAHGASLIADFPGWLQALAVIGAVATVGVGGRYLTRPIFRFIAASRLREIFTAFALLLVIAVSVLMQLVGLSPALGAFLAGVVLAESEFRRELETDIEPFRGLLLGLFFITVGAGLDLGLAAARPVALISVALGLMVLKGLVMFGVARLFRLPARAASTTAVALAQGGEFAFVLLGVTMASGAIPGDLGKLLAAAVAVSMAATPVAMALHERLVLNRRAVLDDPEETAFDEGDPDAIVAGFGRFGQIATRLLIANGYRTVTLDSSIEQIETLRRFGLTVHYGDASRLDLLRTAGAEKAKLLLIAIDDRDKAVEMAEAAREAFPHLTIIARAWDRRHAYELMQHGVTEVERETFEGALVFGARALKRLGLSDRRVARAMSIFRQHDRALFNQLAPVAGEEERYILASRDSRETMDRLLRAEMQRLDAEDDDVDSESLRPLEPEKERV